MCNKKCPIDPSHEVVEVQMVFSSYHKCKVCNEDIEYLEEVQALQVSNPNPTSNTTSPTMPSNQPTPVTVGRTYQALQSGLDRILHYVDNINDIAGLNQNDLIACQVEILEIYQRISNSHLQLKFNGKHCDDLSKVQVLCLQLLAEIEVTANSIGMKQMASP
jgi:hypothetical protein